MVPSLDTPVCDAQTKRFNEEAGKLGDVDIYTVSMDLPFAQKRFCNSFALDNVKMLSDQGRIVRPAYGTLIKELRILSRAIFVVGPDNKIKYVEYVPEVSQHPELRSRSGRRQELTCRSAVPVTSTVCEDSAKAGWCAAAWWWGRAFCSATSPAFSASR